MEDVQKLCNKLEKYAAIEGAEQGDAWNNMLWLVKSYQNYIPNYVYKALCKAIKETVDYLEKNCTIVEEEETYIRKSKRIEYNGN